MQTFTLWLQTFSAFSGQTSREVIEDTYYNGPDAQTEEYLSLSYTKDTVICGLKYSKATFKKQNIYIRNQGKSTYAKLIPNCNSSEMLLYSFDINNFPFYDTLTAPDKKTAITGLDLNLTIDSVAYNGKKHFRVKINVKNSFYNETWIEGVGSTIHPFELLAGRKFTIDGPFWRLACFKDNSQQLSMSKQYNCNADFKPFPLEQDNPLWSELLKQNQFSGGTTYITEKIKYQGKSNFCGKDYSLLNYGSYQMYVRNDGKKTYFRLSNNCNEKEYLLYDFDMKVGDKKYFPMQLNSAKIDSSLFTLKKIDTIWHHFEKVRRFHYDFEYYKSNSTPPNVEVKTMVLQEGVGSLWHPFFPLTRLWASKVDGASFELLCADVNNEAQFRLRFDLNCNIKIVDIDDISATSSNWFISPNPFDENINISNDENMENTSILIFDLNGKTVYNADFQSNTNIDTSNFAKGIYFIQLKNNGKKVVQKMVKM